MRLRVLKHILKCKMYEISVVDEKQETTSEVFMTEDMTRAGVLALLTYMIFF